MLLAFDSLARRLKAVAVVAEQPGHGPVTDLDAVTLEQLHGQHQRALAGPPKQSERGARVEWCRSDADAEMRGISEGAAC